MSKFVIIGRFGSTHGIRGWLKVHSFTDPADNIVDYLPWLIEQQQNWHPLAIEQLQNSSHIILAKIAGCNTPEQACAYVNKLIAIERESLPILKKDEYYWSDLEGLQVINQQGIQLGTIDHLFATGANDVMVVKGDKERLIPYINNTVLQIDLTQGIMIVDWDPEF
jgi:16S rRNA processing protein RimM